MATLHKVKQRVKKPITILIKEAVQKQYKATGEIPDGCDIIEQEPKFIIKLTPGKKHANVQSQDPTNTG